MLYSSSPKDIVWRTHPQSPIPVSSSSAEMMIVMTMTTMILVIVMTLFFWWLWWQLFWWLWYKKNIGGKLGKSWKTNPPTELQNKGSFNLSLFMWIWFCSFSFVNIAFKSPLWGYSSRIALKAFKGGSKQNQIKQLQDFCTFQIPNSSQSLWIRFLVTEITLKPNKQNMWEFLRPLHPVKICYFAKLVFHQIHQILLPFKITKLIPIILTLLENEDMYPLWRSQLEFLLWLWNDNWNWKGLILSRWLRNNCIPHNPPPYWDASALCRKPLQYSLTHKSPPLLLLSKPPSTPKTPQPLLAEIEKKKFETNVI